MADKEQVSQSLENLLFPHIFRTFRMAIQPSKLIIAFLAIAIICLAGWVMDLSKSVVATGHTDTELQVYLAQPDQLPEYIRANKENGLRQGVFSTLWHFSAQKFHGALISLLEINMAGVKENVLQYFKAVQWALAYHYIYCFVFILIKLAVISIAGGAICRIAALQFARNEKPGLFEALRFSTKNFSSFFIAPLLPIGIIICIGFFVALLGAVGNIPVIGELIIAIGTPMALIAGAVIAAIALGAIGGFNLMFPAVAYDGADFFDAMSRAFSYVYARPWQMAFYTLIATVYGAFCYLFVRLFAFLLLSSTHLFLRAGLWVKNANGVNKLTALWPAPNFLNFFDLNARTTAGWSQCLAAILIYFCTLLVIGVVAAFIMSFYFSANTIIYSLIRKKVYNTAIEDVYIHQEELKSGLAPTEPETEQSQ